MALSYKDAVNKNVVFKSKDFPPLCEVLSTIERDLKDAESVWESVESENKAKVEKYKKEIFLLQKEKADGLAKLQKEVDSQRQEIVYWKAKFSGDEGKLKKVEKEKQQQKREESVEKCCEECVVLQSKIVELNTCLADKSSMVKFLYSRMSAVDKMVNKCKKSAAKDKKELESENQRLKKKLKYVKMQLKRKYDDKENRENKGTLQTGIEDFKRKDGNVDDTTLPEEGYEFGKKNENTNSKKMKESQCNVEAESSSVQEENVSTDASHSMVNKMKATEENSKASLECDDNNQQPSNIVDVADKPASVFEEQRETNIDDDGEVVVDNSDKESSFFDKNAENDKEDSGDEYKANEKVIEIYADVDPNVVPILKTTSYDQGKKECLRKKKSIQFCNIVDYQLIDENSTVSVGVFADILKAPFEKYVPPKTSILDGTSLVKIPEVSGHLPPLFTFPKIQPITVGEKKITAADIFDRPCDYTDDSDEELVGDLDADIDYVLNL